MRGGKTTTTTSMMNRSIKSYEKMPSKIFFHGFNFFFLLINTIPQTLEFLFLFLMNFDIMPFHYILLTVLQFLHQTR